VARKTFESARAQVRQEPLEFDFGGSTFAVELPLPSISFLEMVNEDESKALAAFGAFLRDVLGDDQYKTFSAVARRDRTDFETMGEIVAWIVEEATGRPTQQQPASASGSLNATHLSPVAATSAG